MPDGYLGKDFFGRTTYDTNQLKNRMGTYGTYHEDEDKSIDLVVFSIPWHTRFHFYNAFTGKGWLNGTYTDAVTHGRQYWEKAKELYIQGDKEMAYYYLGRYVNKNSSRVHGLTSS